MADRKRLLRLATVLVVGPAVTVLAALGSITSFAADMDVHGATIAMRFAAVAAIAVVLIPFAWWIGSTLCERIDRKAHRTQLAALRTTAAAHPQSSPPARHRKVA